MDPLALATELGDIDLATYEPETDREARPPSEKQLKILAANGIKVEAVKYHGHAHLLVGRILQRHARGLATVRQLNFFANLGVDASLMTRTEASIKQREQIAKWNAKRADKKAEELGSLFEEGHS